MPGVPRGLLGQVVRSGATGVLSTLAHLALCVLPRGAVGPQAANLLALLSPAQASTATNRRVTSGVSGRGGLVRAHAQGLIVFRVRARPDVGALAPLHALADPSRAVEATVLVLANVAATALRFLLLRRRVFGRQAVAVPTQATAGRCAR